MGRRPAICDSADEPGESHTKSERKYCTISLLRGMQKGKRVNELRGEERAMVLLGQTSAGGGLLLGCWWFP